MKDITGALYHALLLRWPRYFGDMANLGYKLALERFKSEMPVEFQAEKAWIQRGFKQKKLPAESYWKFRSYIWENKQV